MRWALTLLIAGCATTTTTTAPPKAKPTTPTTTEVEKATLILDDKLLGDGSDPNVAAAWTMYGGTLAAAGKSDRLASESAARAAAAEFWAAQKGKSTNAYLDALAAVVKAGFIHDYALAYLAEPGWTIGGPTLAKLRPQEFIAWGQKQLANHEPISLARVTWPSDKRPIGDELTAGVVFHDLSECPTIDAQLAPRLQQFAAVEKQLAPMPLSITKLDAFYRALTAPDTRSAMLRRGVVLLSPNVAQAYRLAGLCAVEAQDGPRAEGYLRRLVALSPGDVQGHLELTHTLVMQRRWEDAAATARQALALADNRCRQAIAWRKIGYVEIERHNLDGAREAYVKSLQLDPGNRIAVSELNLIDEKTGKRTAQPAPLPLTDEERRTGTVVTRCPQ
jgi:tetratricopeptide (TPR) repeat protein